MPALGAERISVEYRARVFYQSPLYRVFYDHYDRFQEAYPSRYQAAYGFFRPSIDRCVERFSVCGDPREGVAVFSCPGCSTRKIVPFSCKTRLFCPSCHQKRLLLWVEDLIENVLSPVPHRFWTFSIPKRLRPFFLHDRKLLGLLVQAAHRTFVLVLGNGKVQADWRPALITLIQTHGDELNWNCHLHLLAADGVFDTGDSEKIVFHPCEFWDVLKMAEIFRFTLISLLHKQQVISDDLATNLMSWPHSGFHVHASDPFPATDKEQLERRLAYAFRTPVSLSQITYRNTGVTLRTRKGNTLLFSPLDFLARLTLHIPDTYQHMRRYAGLYASATRRFLGLQKKTPAVTVSDHPCLPRWARLISKIFGSLPIECPRCKKTMSLQGFETQLTIIVTWIPQLTRAPPPKPFTPYRHRHAGRTWMIAAEGVAPYPVPSVENQVRPDSSDDFDQRISW